MCVYCIVEFKSCGGLVVNNVKFVGVSVFFAESTGSLLSLVKTFDSMLAVYEGFCNLKQVTLIFS